MADEAVVEEEVEEAAEVKVPDTILRSEVLSGSQEAAKKVFASLLANGEVFIEEDPVEEPEEAEEDE